MFSDILETDIDELLKCLNAETKRFSKGQCVFSEGEQIKLVGFLNSGLLLLERIDYWGNRTIWNRIEPGDTFCEAYAYASNNVIPFNVVADADSVVTLMDCSRVLKTCSNACRFHSSVIMNLTRILAEKNVQLSRKLELVTERTTREKLLSYLSEQAQIAKSSSFTIPYDRQELADFLAVERSAMSAELSHMKQDGLIKYNRSNFELLK